MSPRVEEEIAMLKACWPSLEFIEAGQWVLLPHQPLPVRLWDRDEVDVAIQIPPQLPGQAPYGFYVRHQAARLANGLGDARFQDPVAAGQPARQRNGRHLGCQQVLDDR